MNTNTLERENAQAYIIWNDKEARWREQNHQGMERHFHRFKI